ARVAVQATGGDFGRAGAAHSRRGILGPVARVHARMTTTALAAPLAFAPPLVTVALVGGCPEALRDHLALTGGAGGVLHGAPFGMRKPPRVAGVVGGLGGG